MMTRNFAFETSNKFSGMQCSLAAAVCLLTPLSAQAEASNYSAPPFGATGSTVYVQVSSANLRAQAQKSAPILDKPVTNSAFKLIAKNSEWCEVEGVRNDVISADSQPETATKNLHGYMACELLSSQMLTLKIIEEQLARPDMDAKVKLAWYARAFWVAPSLARWERMGIAMQMTYLDEATHYKEIEGNKPLRFQVPEFEAMKKRLAAGIQVKPESYSPSQVGNQENLGNGIGNLQSAHARIKMPVIKTSMFNVNNVPIIVAGEKYYGMANNSSGVISLTDALSASNSASFRAVVTAPASYALNPDSPIYADDTTWRFTKVSGAMDVILGIWDVGGLRITFDKNVTLHGVTAQGKPTALDIREINLSIGYDSACSYSHSQVEIRSTPVSGYAPSASALINWAGKPIPGGATARAQIKSRRFGGEGPTDLVITHEIDLDHDGVVDFLIWQGRYQAQVSAEGLWEAIFANIDGQWRLLGYNEDADCT
jgi:hypothetical protein